MRFNVHCKKLYSNLFVFLYYFISQNITQNENFICRKGFFTRHSQTFNKSTIFVLKQNQTVSQRVLTTSVQSLKQPQATPKHLRWLKPFRKEKLLIASNSVVSLYCSLQTFNQTSTEPNAFRSFHFQIM